MMKFSSVFIAVCMSIISLRLFATDIGTAAEFVSAMATGPAGDYTLTADIDLTDSGYAAATEFSGSLDGAGHVITGLGAKSLFTLLTGTVENLVVDGRVGDVNTSVQQDAGFAVFAVTAQGATVRNCRVEGYTIKANSKKNSVAGLVRTVKDGTLVIGCISGSSMIIKTNINVPGGGLVATVSCTSGYSGPWTARFVACTNLAEISMAAGHYNPNPIGGIVGSVSTAMAGFPRTEFSNCVNNAAITGMSKGNIGGIVGHIAGTGTSSTAGTDKGSDVSFVGCRNEGAITASGSDNHLGGILGEACAGSSRTTFTNCVNRANIAAESVDDSTDFVGGVMGYCGDPNHNAKTLLQFVNCANYGNVLAYCGGGILGYMRANDGWAQGNFRFLNSANYGVVSALTRNKSGGIFGYYASTKTTIPLLVENCWSLCSPVYGPSSGRGPSSMTGTITSMDVGYTTPGAVTSLNTAVTVGSGYETWVQGRYYPEFAANASSPTPGKVDVMFRDWDGTPIKTEAIDSGSDATAPADPVREGYLFTGWDKPFSGLMELTLVTAQYQIQQHSYQFNTQGGSPVETIVANYDEPINVADPVRAGYVFKGWSLDRGMVTTIPARMTADDRVYYALWKSETVAGCHTAFSFLQWKCACGNSDSFFNAMNNVLASANADIVSVSNYKGVSYASRLVVSGYTNSVKAANGTSDGNARMVCWKTAKFRTLSGGLSGTTGSPQTNMTAFYVLLEELSTGNQFLVFNAFAGTQKSINGYNGSIANFVNGIVAKYPAAYVIWGTDCEGQASRSEYATTYGSNPQNVANEFITLSGMTGIQTGNDFQWTYSGFVPTSYSVVTNAPDGTFSTKYGYMTNFTLGSVGHKSGLQIFFR